MGVDDDVGAGAATLSLASLRPRGHAACDEVQNAWDID
jgi:hypothetical protein